MKLYFAPGACSLASHITLLELGLPFEAIAVDLKKKTTKSGVDYNIINPKGYVPALELDDGSILTEGTAILQYLADQKAGAALAPANGTLARYRLQEWLGFINSEVHKSFSPLFAADTPDATRQASKDRLAKRFDYIEGTLGKKPFLMGEQFTVADAYLHTVLGWSKLVGIELAKWPAISAYQTRIAGRPAVQAAKKAEHGG